MNHCPACAGSLTFSLQPGEEVFFMAETGLADNSL